MKKTAQKEIYESEFSASAGGIVTVTVLGTKELVKVEISEDFEISVDKLKVNFWNPFMPGYSGYGLARED